MSDEAAPGAPGGRPITILYVEDNPDHAELVLRALEDHGLVNEVRHVADGEQALHYLLRTGDFADPAESPRPDVMLLDLRLPKVDGLEVLRTVKSSDALKRIPVVVLTTSAAEADVVSAYDEHVNAYLVKPIDFADFQKLMRDLGFFWLAWNTRPVGLT